MNIMDRMAEAIVQKQNPTAVGLDTRVEYLPEGFFKPGADFQKSAGGAIFDFNRALIDAVADIVPAVKVQVAFYEMYGVEGMTAFKRTLEYAKQAGLIVIADVKRGDIGSTAEAYAHAFLSGTPAGEETLPAFESDIVTVNPYLGTDGIKPFADACAQRGKGIFVLVKTSNPSGGEFQDLIANGRPVYEHVGRMTAKWGEGLIGKSGYSAIGAVVGATYPEQGERLRAILPNTFFLIPGYGAQGGTAGQIAKSFDGKGGGAVVNASRSIMCAYKKQPGVPFAAAARNEALRMKEDLLAALGGRIG